MKWVLWWLMHNMRSIMVQESFPIIIELKLTFPKFCSKDNEWINLLHFHTNSFDNDLTHVNLYVLQKEYFSKSYKKSPLFLFGLPSDTHEYRHVLTYNFGIHVLYTIFINFTNSDLLVLRKSNLLRWFLLISVTV